MKRYRPPKPGVAFALAAVAMTVVTMLALVMLPAEVEALGDGAQAPVASRVSGIVRS